MKRLLLPVILVATAVTALSFFRPAPKPAILNHIAYYVHDLKKSTAFYKDLIQLDTIPEPFHDGRHTWFNVGTVSHLHLIQGAAAGLPHDKNTHLCFSVPSIDDMMQRLEKAGITWENWAGTGKTPTLRVDGVRQIYFQDPDGYWVEINDDKMQY